MKRILFSLLVVFSFSALHAQEWRDENRYHDPFDIYCGPTIGVAASNMTEYDGKYKFGPQIGAFIQTYFCNHFGMSFELNYSREGTRDAWQSFQPDRAGGPYDYSMDYINTIYKMRYYPMHRMNVFLGFKFGVHINASCTLDGKSTDIKGALRRRAGHIIGGFGYELDKLNIESKLTTVLYATANNGEYQFQTHAHNSTAKTPMGAIEEDTIPNDITIVLKALEDY